jgi:glutamate formiminotransferase
VADSEVVGLVPLDAMLDVARAYLQLHAFERDQVMEIKLME